MNWLTKQLRLLIAVVIIAVPCTMFFSSLWYYRDLIARHTGIDLASKPQLISATTLIKLKNLERVFMEELIAKDSILATYYKRSDLPAIPDSSQETVEDYVQTSPYSTRLNGIDTTKFSVELCAAVGVDFPYIHGVLIPFKETSFCKDTEGGKSYPTFCSEDWEHIMPGLKERGGWNPYNASGMKYPSHRPTTAICSNGEMFRQFRDKYGLKLAKGYEKFYDDPHACYEDYVQHAIDLKLWQQRWYSIFEQKAFKRGIKWKKPETPVEYIMFLKESGYNPYPRYYRRPDGGGLLDLYEASLRGDFEKKYGKIYQRRMGLSLDTISKELMESK